MIKGVFFDWFNTLAHYQTPREELYSEAFRGAGLDIPPAIIYQGLQTADRHYFSKQNMANNPGNSISERARFYYLYPQSILSAAGAELPYEKQMIILEKVLSSFSPQFVLYDDVLPVILKLRAIGKSIGIITNADRKVVQLVHSLVDPDMIDCIVTSEEAGSEKPYPSIFNLALNKLSLNSKESVYVGDQYQSDVVGATGAGMQAILIDRYDITKDGPDFKRVTGMQQIFQYI